MKTLQWLPAFLAFVAGAFASETGAPDLAALLEQGRAAEAALDPQAALVAYEAAAVLAPEDPFVLQKVAQQLSDLTPRLSDPAAKRLHAERALAFAERALALAPDDPVVVLSVAICHGKLAGYADVRGKVVHSRRVRELAERAAQLDPNYDWAHHVLGRWHVEVAGLGKAARWWLKVVYGGLPEASVARAITHLEQARTLAPARVPHRVELGLAYLAAGRAAEGRAMLEEAVALPSSELHDEEAKRRALAALRDPAG